MRAAFDNLPVFDEQNAISMGDRRQTMGDDKRRAVFRQTIKRFLNVLLIFQIERRRRLVKNENRWIFQKHASDGNPLFLPAGKLDAALTD